MIGYYCWVLKRVGNTILIRADFMMKLTAFWKNRIHEDFLKLIFGGVFDYATKSGFINQPAAVGISIWIFVKEFNS